MIKLSFEQRAMIKWLNFNDSTYIYAGHLPTRVFTQAEWLVMPIIIETLSQHYASLISPGPFRTTQRGRPVVFYSNWETKEYWQVRPIVRVPMGRYITGPTFNYTS